MKCNFKFGRPNRILPLKHEIIRARVGDAIMTTTVRGGSSLDPGYFYTAYAPTFLAPQYYSLSEEEMKTITEKILSETFF